MSEAHVEAVKANFSGTKQPERSEDCDSLQTRVSNRLLQKVADVNALYQDYPLITTFIIVFSIFSAIPILTFCGTSVFILSSFLLVSTGFALCSALTVISLSGLALFAFLALAMFATLFLMTSAVAIYLSARLLYHIYTQMSAENSVFASSVFVGTKNWFTELRIFLLHEAQFFSGRFTSSGYSDHMSLSALSAPDGKEKNITE